MVRHAEVPIAVHADRSQLEQALLNLALNARDAMLDPQATRDRLLTIEVDSRVVTAADGALFPDVPPGSYARVRVSDTGHGMSRETLARAFEPFFTTKDVGRGTGLGLSTVLGVVQQAGGAVWAESTLGEGTTVTVLLPLLEGEGEPGSRDDSAPPAAAHVGTARLLVVEDDAMVRTTTIRVLSRAGYRVEAAEDGQRGLDLWRAAGGAFDLVLTDVRMPTLGGVELARILAREAPKTPVVFMTGYAEEELEAGMVLRKPFTPRQLLDAIAAALRDVAE